MQEPLLAAVFAMWIVLALGLGWVMGRRGFEAYTWTFLGVVLGPIAVFIAATTLARPPAHEPKLLRRGHPRSGDVDILVGTDGSPESRSARAAAEILLRGRVGRITLARVIPIDAPPDVVRDAEASLEAEGREAGRKASTVLLRGVPADALRDYAMRLGYELIAVGTRGEGHNHALLGSVASTLAHGSTVPVLLTNATKVTQARTATPQW